MNNDCPPQPRSYGVSWPVNKLDVNKLTDQLNRVQAELNKLRREFDDFKKSLEDDGK